MLLGWMNGAPAPTPEAGEQRAHSIQSVMCLFPSMKAAGSRGPVAPVSAAVESSLPPVLARRGGLPYAGRALGATATFLSPVRMPPVRAIRCDARSAARSEGSRVSDSTSARRSARSRSRRRAAASAVSCSPLDSSDPLPSRAHASSDSGRLSDDAARSIDAPREAPSKATPPFADADCAALDTSVLGDLAASRSCADVVHRLFCHEWRFCGQVFASIRGLSGPDRPGAWGALGTPSRRQSPETSLPIFFLALRACWGCCALPGLRLYDGQRQG